MLLQPLRLEIKRILAQKSERVKSVDLHPTEPWILASLYSGSVCIWNYQSQMMEEDGVEEAEERAVELDLADSTDSSVLVNGNEGEEQWGTDKGTPLA